ncbi:hypothetical protein ACTG9Q_30240 [Actinokineospora sp. 24-640]
MTRPIEVRAVILIFAVGAVAFVGAGILRDAVAFPLLAAIVSGLTAAGLVTRWHPARGVAFVVAALLAVAHTLVVLGPVHWGFRVLSGVLAAGYVYVVVLLLTKPAREYFGGVFDE